MTQSIVSPMLVMAGLLLQHRIFGCCKIVSVEGVRVAIQLCDGGGRRQFSRQALEGGDFQRATLHAGAIATGPRGKCAVKGIVDRSGTGPRSYSIEYFEDGLSATVSEIDLTPSPVGLSDSLNVRLLQGRTDPYAAFSARHRLLVALGRFNRQVGGLRALLASRIDLHPHQAFVAGTVILDPVRRYVLADEVGLGKTIEAGIILHDLLARRPDARVLVLTPGPLTRQWLCEMHSSFGGQGFKLADLHPIEAVDLAQWTKVICSTNFALDGLDNDLARARWDLVIVDEVHHLLNSPHLYDLVMRLSHGARDLLLLSAVPVRRREGELYRLLALLDPRVYGEDGVGEAAFLQIYAAQESLGRRLNLLARDLDDLAQSEAEPDDVVVAIERLLSLPILQGDAHLQSLLLEAHAAPRDAGVWGREVHATVSERYRVNRRILRNRRERLISQDRLTAIARVPAPLGYEPDQVEAEAVTAVQAFLSALSDSEALSPEVLRPFSQMLLQALVDPVATFGVLTKLRDARGAQVNSYGREMLNAVVGMSGERWLVQLETACAGVKPYVDDHFLEVALERVSNWSHSASSSGRWDVISSFLQGEVSAGRKTLVFAGFPGVAERLANHLQQALGEKVIIQFRSDLDDMTKEENVRRFRVDPRVAVMVSDESGGEGRNFQFAHSLLHADLPWQPAVIEQRIGRLDRLGRETISSEVISHVCLIAGGWEAGLYACYHDGLNLFGSSISGLEFALRRLQDEIIDAALGAGEDGLRHLVPRLKSLADDERVRDESEALLDEASYNSARGARFIRAPIEGGEAGLEEAFLEHFRALTKGKGVWPHLAADGTKGLWGMRPSDAAHGELNIVDKDAAGELGKRVGTFQRSLAQRHRDIEFFSYGNPLFDAVVASLGQRLTGRTYAIACRAPGGPSFVGLEIIVAARPKLDPASVPPSLLNLAEAIFGTRRRPLFVPLLAGQFADRDQLGAVRTSLSAKSEGRLWRDLSGDDVQQLVRAVDGDLSNCLDRALQDHIPLARQEFAAELAVPLMAELERVSIHRRQLLDAADPTSMAEAQMLEGYAALIGSWDIIIDGLGFFALNPPGVR